MSGFRIGDVVVCVDDSPCRAPHLLGLPFAFKRGTVKKISYVCLDGRGKVAIRFTDGPEPIGPGFVAERFRKIQKADNAFTAQMRALKPIKQKA